MVKVAGSGRKGADGAAVFFVLLAFFVDASFSGV